MTITLLHVLPVAVPAAGWATHALYLARRLRTVRTDPLTTLMCRDEFTGRALRAVRHPDAAVLLLDLDDFKCINDTYGHAAGDQALAAVGQRLEEWCRERHGFAARLGGDEFAAVVRLAENADLHVEVLYGLWARLGEAVTTTTGAVLYPRASIGVCRAIQRPDAGLPELLRGADEAMYTAKRLGHRWHPARPYEVYGTVNGRRIGRPGTHDVLTRPTRTREGER